MVSDYRDILYLACGNQKQIRTYQILKSVDIFNILSKYSPVLTGTIPLDIDIDSSDLDIICQIDTIEDFIQLLTDNFQSFANFQISQTIVDQVDTVIANFHYQQFELEIFGQPIPVIKQHAYRHMMIEARLLQIFGETARIAIRELKRQGLKTEPAFACYFGITGDPYQALLALADLSDTELLNRLSSPADHKY